MQKKISFLVLICILLTGCSVADSEDEKEIAFIYQQVDLDDTLKNEGFFIDEEGNQYFFDLSMEDREYVEGDNLYMYLQENIEQYSGIPCLKQDEITQWQEYLKKVDTEREMYKMVVHSGSYGDFYYGIRSKKNGKAEVVLLSTSYGWTMRTRDEDGEKLLELYKEIVNEYIYE